MKKVLCLLLVVMVLLTGCGTDPVAQKVMDDIESIGEVKISDKEKIEDISETYKELTEKQKNQVKNYADLLEAQDKIEELEKQQEQEKLNLPEYAAAIEVAKLTKDSLYNSESFQIKDIGYYVSLYDTIEESDGCFFIKMEYAGENKLGGTATKTTIYRFDNYQYTECYNDEGYDIYNRYELYIDEEYIPLDIDFILEHME